MGLTNNKSSVAILSVISNSFLIIIKIIAGLLSGSVSIVSEAIHSGMDLIAAIIAFIAVKISSKPADKDHPYGHGKVENVSGVIEGILILIAAILIITEAVKKIIRPEHIGETNIALIVMFISSAVNFFISRKLFKVAKEIDSVALEADALHLKTDVYTSAGVGVGMLLIKITGIEIFDPIVAILVALLIVKEAWSLIWNAYCPLLDTKLSDSEEDKIKNVINSYNGQIIDFHELRTRKSGSIKYIDFHMTVNKNLSVEDSHALSERIEKDLEEALKNTNVSIHIEPGV
ncbi:MAG: cation diffusion facilitator family transporter [Bacillota bacterium]|nr:cation diffusion facilitator family transporter [Bacillota bacterium]